MKSGIDRGEPIARVRLYRVEVATAGEKGSATAREVDVGGVEDEETGQIRSGTNAGEAVSVNLRQVEIACTDLFLDGNVTIGRQEACDLRPMRRHNRRDKSVSRVHCIISGKLNDDGTARIEVTDMSMNASFVDDKGKMKRGDTLRLEVGSFLAFGSNVFEEDLNAEPRRFRVRYELVEAKVVTDDSILVDSRFEFRTS